MLNAINAELKATGFTLCSLAFNMIGLLKDQSNYYLSTYEDITKEVELKGA